MSRGRFLPVVTLEPSCARPQGGDKTVGAPVYSLTVTNPNIESLNASCLWQDDPTGIIIQENDGDPICLDNV